MTSFKDKTIVPNIRDDEGYTALHWYVRKSRRDRHKSLLLCLQSGCGFDIDAKDHFDNTPLHIAAEVSFKRIKCLIDQYIIHVHVKLRAFSNLYSNHETNLLYLEK